MLVRISALTRDYSDMFRAGNRATPCVVPWTVWGPAHSRVLDVKKWRIYASTGLHVFTHEAVLNCNPYDLAHDIYSPRAPVNEFVSTVAPSADSTSWSTMMSSQPKMTQEQHFEKYGTRMPFRHTQLVLPRIRGSFRSYGIALLESETMPQVSGVTMFEGSSRWRVSS